MVFCSVEGGKVLAATSRREAKAVHEGVISVFRNTALQVDMDFDVAKLNCGGGL
jgi:hypothetical protein